MDDVNMKKFRYILWGIVFVVIGLILLLNVLNVIDINLFFKGWWTLFIIIPCFIEILVGKQKIANAIGFSIGVVLLLCCQRIFDFILICRLLIPGALIVIGLVFIFKDYIKPEKIEEKQEGEENKKEDKE